MPGAISGPGRISTTAPAGCLSSAPWSRSANGTNSALHVRAALTEGGFTPDDIKEILLQQAIYCGVPAANHAVKEAAAIVAELGLLKK